MHASASPFDALNWQIVFDCRAGRKKTKRTRRRQYPAQQTVALTTLTLEACRPEERPIRATRCAKTFSVNETPVHSSPPAKKKKRHKAAVAPYRRGVPVTRCVGCCMLYILQCSRFRRILNRLHASRYWRDNLANVTIRALVIPPLRSSELAHQRGGSTGGADLLHAGLVCGFLLRAEGVAQCLCLLLGLFHAL